MSLSLDQLRSAFKKETNANTGNALGNYYPFHKMQTGESSTVRFLPDLNTDNPRGFLVEKRTHTLTINGQKRNVPCRTMYGEDCPICKVSSAYYKANDTVNGKKYWRKLQYIAQALVVDSPIQPAAGEEPAAGTVKLLTINPQLYKVIKEAFESGDLENIPFDYELGTNFIIKKDQQGEYASYILSKFAKRETALDDETIEFVKSQLKDLSTILPKCPDLAEVEAMLEADMTGAEYKAGNQARPAAGGDDDEDADMKAAMERMRNRRQAAIAEDEDDEPAPVRTPTPAPASSDDDDDDDDDIIAQLKARRARS